MPRHVAFLRGVFPKVLRMADLRTALETAGFTNVRTILSSGNVAFDTRAGATAALERRIERALVAQVGRSFDTIVRTTASLEALLAADPYAAWDVVPAEKRIVTFLRTPPAVRPALPIVRDGARILAMTDTEVVSVYVPDPRGPDWMQLLERTFGTGITTRTLDTVRKCAAA